MIHYIKTLYTSIAYFFKGSGEEIQCDVENPTPTSSQRPIGEIKLGDFSYKHKTAFVKCWNEPCVVQAGKYCSIAGCKFVYDGNHNPYYATTYPFKELDLNVDAPMNRLKKPATVIGNDVWIADDAVIYSGVKIGDGAIVAGQSVVTRDVEPYSIVAGNPARLVKYRFPKEMIDRFMDVRWWDLPSDKVCRDLAPLMSDPVRFLEVAESFRDMEKNILKS